MKKITIRPQIYYILFSALFILLYFVLNPNFREDDWGAIRKIVFPQYYTNPNYFFIDLGKYNPYYNHYYLSGYVIKFFGLEHNFVPAGQLFWFVEQGLMAFLFVLLAKQFFGRNWRILALTFLWVVFYSPSPWAEPKFAATIFMMLSMLYYFRRKLFAASFFAATIFYFHIGFATWWFLTFLFVLAWLWLKDREISFVQCVQCATTTVIIALPIIWTYYLRMTDARVDDFTNMYAYYSLGYQASPLLAITQAPGFIISRILSIILVLLAVRKAKSTPFDLSRIGPIAWGVIALMVTQLVLGDLMNMIAVSKTQLIRAPVITDILWPILVSFLIAEQVQRKQYFFGIFALIILWGYNLTPKIFGLDMYAAFNIFCILLILYLTFEKNIASFKLRSVKVFVKIGERLFNSLTILILSLAVMVVKLPFIKPAIKATLNRSDDPAKTAYFTKKDAFLDVFDYMNANIPYGETAFLFPFTQSYIFNYTHHNIFNINSETPVHSLFYNNQPSYQFQEVFEKDLGCTIEKVFVEKDPRCDWANLWRDLDEGMLRHWKGKYGLTHVMREKDLPLDFPVAYSNDFYVLYVVQ